MGVISKPNPEVRSVNAPSRPIRVDVEPSLAPVRKPLQRLREMRLKKNLSVGQMAMLLRVSPSQVWIEEDPTADVSLSAIKNWCQALDVPMHELLIEQQCNMQLVGVSSSQLSRITSLASAMANECDEESTTANLIGRLVDQLEQLQESRE